MEKAESIQKANALVIGAILAVLGLWGFFVPNSSSSILNIFSINYVQSALHLIGGLFGLYVGLKEHGHGYNVTIGWILFISGIIGFIPIMKDYMIAYFNTNLASSLLHLVLGAISLVVYYELRK